MDRVSCAGAKVIKTRIDGLIIRQRSADDPVVILAGKDKKIIMGDYLRRTESSYGGGDDKDSNEEKTVKIQHTGISFRSLESFKHNSAITIRTKRFKSNALGIQKTYFFF
jgi:hypothetical protein